jgi:hypothetical protein
LISLTLLSSLIVISACNKKTDEGSTGTTDESTANDLIQTSVNAVNDGISALNSSQTFALRTESTSSDVGVVAACSTLATPTCTSGHRTLDFNSCTRTNSSGVSITINGTVDWAFSDTANCNIDALNETVTRTHSDHYVTLASGEKILIYTGEGTVGGKSIAAADLLDYNNVNRSGGHVLTNTGTDTRSLAINGVHRRKVRASGVYGFWHTVYTDSGSPLTITIGGDTKTISGTVNVAHNRLQSTATTTYTNVTFNSSCCYPVGGTVTYASGSESITSVFSAECGVATIGDVATTLPACGGSVQ